ncbi:hypothetical protein E4K68_01445 [Desulfosporosinus sp. Sb-LF]|nr:hypothetical protein E4K68_01445 [Desulfosporosinus sp. Sb-LF]
MITLYALLFWNMRHTQPLKIDAKLLLGIPIIALSFTYFIYSNPIFAVLNFLMIPSLLVAHTLLLTSNHRYKWFESRFLLEVLRI